MPKEKSETLGVWVKESKKGNVYFSFNVDGVPVIGMENIFKEEDKHPDFRFFTKDKEGNLVPVGAGWENKSKKGNEYIFVKLNVNDKEYVLRVVEATRKKSEKSPDFIAFIDDLNEVEKTEDASEDAATGAGTAAKSSGQKKSTGRLSKFKSRRSKKTYSK